MRMTQVTGINNYDNMRKWQKKHEENDRIANERLNKNKSENNGSSFMAGLIFKIHDYKKEKIGTDFDFMEGKNAENEEDYNAQVQNLGKGDVLAMDTDGDGKVSVKEYIAHETEDLSDEDSLMFRLMATKNSKDLFKIIDEKMGNGDGSLDEEELAAFYKGMDGFETDKNGEAKATENYDGKINIDDSGEYVSYLLENFRTEENAEDNNELTEERLKELKSIFYRPYLL